MTLHRRPLSRRAMLGGAAALLALPVLDSLEPVSQASTPEWTRRFIGYYVPNGMMASGWTPKLTGPDFALSPTLAGLAGHEDQLLVLSGLDNDASDPGVPGHHAAGTAGFLTAARPRKSETDLWLGPSIDQLFADHVAGQTPLHSLQLGLEGGGAGIGHCDNGFACAYSRSISWAGPRTPLSKIVSPRMAFDLLFAGYDPDATGRERERRRALRRSALDSVQADVHDLRKRLGSSDSVRLDEYLDSVRALERRVEQPAPTCSAEGLEFELDVSFADADEHARVMAEIMVMALRCDLTRSITFMLGNSASTRSYPQLGIGSTHHDLSHHAGDVDKIKGLLAIEAWEIEQFAYLIQRLRETPEGEGSLLDHCLVLLSSELSDASNHSHKDLPVLIAGSCGGAVGVGRHVAHEAGTAYGGLLLAIAQTLEVPIEELGEARSPLASLWG
jgi:hypothetical protein